MNHKPHHILVCQKAKQFEGNKIFEGVSISETCCATVFKKDGESTGILVLKKYDDAKSIETLDTLETFNAASFRAFILSKIKARIQSIHSLVESFQVLETACVGQIIFCTSYMFKPKTAIYLGNGYGLIADNQRVALCDLSKKFTLSFALESIFPALPIDQIKQITKEANISFLMAQTKDAMSHKNNNTYDHEDPTCPSPNQDDPQKEVIQSSF